MRRLLLTVSVLSLSILLSPITSEAQSVWPKDAPSSYLRNSKTRPPIEKGDIIRVQVIEDDVASNDARLDAIRQTQAEILIDQFVKFAGLKPEVDLGPFPEVAFEANKNVISRGRTDRRESLRILIAAKVVDVLPNGNLVIEASKNRQLNDEATTVTLSGEIRSADVLADYSVTSDRIYGIDLKYTGEGSVSGNVAWTWLTRLIDWLWPF